MARRPVLSGQFRLIPLAAVDIGRPPGIAQWGVVIVPRVLAETTENVFQVLWFRQSGQQTPVSRPALTKRWSSDAEIPVHMVMPIIRRSSLIEDQAWRTTLRASSVVQTYSTQTISTREARSPLPSQSQPVSWPTLRPIEPDTRISWFNVQPSGMLLISISQTKISSILPTTATPGTPRA